MVMAMESDFLLEPSAAFPAFHERMLRARGRLDGGQRNIRPNVLQR